MSVTIVIPNHHEPMIDETVERLRTLECPIVVANDPDGRGIGWAIREGLKEVETEWVLFAMADGSEDPRCLKRMIDPAGQWGGFDFRVQVAFWGDRWRRGTVTGYPWLKRVVNRVANHLLAAQCRYAWYTDWTDLAKCYRTYNLRQLTWSDDFRCGIEIPLRYYRRFMRRGNWSIVPMHWQERRAGKSSYRLAHVVGSLRALIQVTLYG